MKPRVFIGSSYEAIAVARSMAELLRELHDVEPVVWDECFDFGALTFEALEQQLPQYSGAILIATPDDPATIRGKKVMLPRANVMVEFAYTAALLSRKRVILAVHQGVRLPTDFDAIACLMMGPYEIDAPIELSAKLRDRLKVWLTSLMPSIEGFTTSVVCGSYTGRWRFSVEYNTWWGHEIQVGDFARTDGIADLIVNRDGSGGYGTACADIRISFGGKSAHIKTVEASDWIKVDSLGNLEIITANYLRNPCFVDPGLLEKPGFRQEFPIAPPALYAKLSPCSAPTATLRGHLSFNTGTSLESGGSIVMHRLKI